MRVAGFLLAAVVALTGLAAIAPASAANTAATLVVRGNHLVDTRTNTIFVPHGANFPGYEYSCVQGWQNSNGGSAEAAVIASWKINTIRIPLNQSCWLGINGYPNNGWSAAQYRSQVSQWVNALNAAGVAVILDLHWSAPGTVAPEGQRAMADSQSVGFWSSVASTFASNPSVIFDLFNEPYSRGSFTLSWDCWKSGGCQMPVVDDTQGLTGATFTVTGMDALVAAVRGAGATQPIMLGGLNYSNDLTGWLAHRPADTQLVASWHNYPGQGCSDTTCWNSTIAPIAAIVPIVMGEFGNTAEQAGTVGSASYLITAMTWGDQHGVGYLPWAWWDVPYSESPSASAYALYEGSAYTPKAPSGTKYHDHLAALPVPLTPGRLVKSSSSSAVYLVDGVSTLVPTSAAAADAGVNPSVATVSLAGYTVGTTPLTNVVTCGSTPYLAASAKLRPVAPSLVAGLPFMSLDPATCAALPHGPSVTSPLYLNSYLISNGFKTAADTAGFSVNTAFLNAIPTVRTHR